MLDCPDLEAPADDATIWRIMDVPRLLAILAGRSLFLPRASALGDEHEGAFPPHQPPLDRALDLIPPAWRASAIRVKTSPGLLELGRNLRDWVYVSCWYVAQHESAALWTLYGHGQGVAIRSTVGRFRKAIGPITPFRPDVQVFALQPQVGAVRYVDYAAVRFDARHPLLPFFHKRLEYEAEREFRLVCAFLPIRNGVVDFNGHNAWPGVAAAADLDELIESVWFAPETPDWQVETLTRILPTFNVGAPTHASVCAFSEF